MAEYTVNQFAASQDPFSEGGDFVVLHDPDDGSQGGALIATNSLSETNFNRRGIVSLSPTVEPFGRNAYVEFELGAISDGQYFGGGLVSHSNNAADSGGIMFQFDGSRNGGRIIEYADASDFDIYANNDVIDFGRALVSTDRFGLSVTDNATADTANWTLYLNGTVISTGTFAHPDISTQLQPAMGSVSNIGGGSFVAMTARDTFEGLAVEFTESKVLSVENTTASLSFQSNTNATYAIVLDAFNSAQPIDSVFDSATITGSSVANQSTVVDVDGLTVNAFATIHIRINDGTDNYYATANTFAPDVGHDVLILGETISELLTATDSNGDPIALVQGLYLHYDTQNGNVTLDSEGDPQVAQGTTTTTANLIDVSDGSTGADATLSFSGSSDVTPDSFSFTAQTNAALSSSITSNEITVLGVDAGQDIPVVANNLTYQVSTDNGATFGAETSANSNVQLNYRIRVIIQSSDQNNTETTGTLSVGGVVRQFSVTTVQATPAPVFSTLVSVADIQHNNANVTFTADQDATAKVIYALGQDAAQPSAALFDAAIDTSVTANQQVTQSITGLSANTNYTAWVRISNENGTTYDSENFLTVENNEYNPVDGFMARESRLVKVSTTLNEATTLKEGFDADDIDTIWFAWDAILLNNDIVTSEFILPSGWFLSASRTNESVKDSNGTAYMKANSVTLTTQLTSGRHHIVNRVTTLSGDRLDRGVFVTINAGI